ncbi:MAG: hypothetical protein H7343_11425 [Undibacterium sp.]|nr:hypothetical protein [Opitutaceae bacterium]
MINAGLTISGDATGFPLGVFAAQLVMYGFASADAAGSVIGIGFNVVVIGLLLLLGVFACRAHRWAFVTVALGYGADTLLVSLLAPSTLGTGIHLWALIALVSGWKNAGALNRARAAQPADLSENPSSSPGAPASSGLPPVVPRPWGTSPEKIDAHARETEEICSLSTPRNMTAAPLIRATTRSSITVSTIASFAGSRAKASGTPATTRWPT